MRYLYVSPQAIVTNIVEHPTAPPAFDDVGNYIILDEVPGVYGASSVFPLAAYLTAQQRSAANTFLINPDSTAKALRATILTLLDEINALRQQIVGITTAVFDPANMANGSGTTSPNLTVAGAAFGDVVDVSAPYSLAGIVATGYVSAANTVNIRLHNSTGGAVNLASGTWQVMVRRHAVLPDRTIAQAKTAIASKIDAGTADV